MSREAFLERVRQAVTEGNRAGRSGLPERGNVGYQGAEGNPVEKFCTELAGAGGLAYLTRGAAEAVEVIVRLVQEKGARQVLLGRGPLLNGLELEKRLTAAGCEVLAVERFSAKDCREPFFAADLGISQPAHLIAETGTLAVLASLDDPRSVSLLPPIHIAVASSKQILPDLFDLFSTLKPGELPSCATLITGPSKTGDIELKLVTGVHGPGEVHVVLLVE